MKIQLSLPNFVPQKNKSYSVSRAQTLTAEIEDYSSNVKKKKNDISVTPRIKDKKEPSSTPPPSPGAQKKAKRFTLSVCRVDS